MSQVLGAILLTMSAAAAAEPLGGVWSSPLGKMSLMQRGDAVIGEMQSPAEGCGLSAKSVVLKGDLLEDSLSGQVQVCLSGCDSKMAWVPVLLLVSPDAHVLSGTTTLPKGCASPLGYLRTALRNGFTSKQHMREDSDLASLRQDTQFKAMIGGAEP
jgi:hypothetical protein